MPQQQYSDIQIALGQMWNATIAQLRDQLFVSAPVAPQNPNADARLPAPDREHSVMPIDAPLLSQFPAF
jgi:hypothetical protein